MEAASMNTVSAVIWFIFAIAAGLILFGI